MSYITLEISKEIIKEVKKKKRKIKEIKIYRRLLFLEMKHKKKLNKEIALLIDVTIETLSHWTAIYKKGGVDLLCKMQYEGRRKSSLTPFIEQIKTHIKTENVSTLKSLQHWLDNNCKVKVGISWLHEFCKKNSIFLIKKQD